MRGGSATARGRWTKPGSEVAGLPCAGTAEKRPYSRKGPKTRKNRSRTQKRKALPATAILQLSEAIQDAHKMSKFKCRATRQPLKSCYETPCMYWTCASLVFIGHTKRGRSYKRVEND